MEERGQEKSPNEQLSVWETGLNLTGNLGDKSCTKQGEGSWGIYLQYPSLSLVEGCLQSTFGLSCAQSRYAEQSGFSLQR